jgi:IS1 family transposase
MTTSLDPLLSLIWNENWTLTLGDYSTLRTLERYLKEFPSNFCCSDNLRKYYPRVALQRHECRERYQTRVRSAQVREELHDTSTGRRITA